MRTYLLFVATLLLVSTTGFGQLKVGEVPPNVKLAGDDGAKVDGTPWESSTIKGKVHTLFYVDPDEKDINEEMENALKKEDFPKEKYQSIAIINMDATWLPNTFIASALASKQEKFPDVVYAKDLEKVLVKKWGLKDDTYVVLVFDKDGKVLLEDNGKLDGDRIKKLIDTIKSNL